MRLQSDRLLLREFTADDWPTVLAYQSDERYLLHYAWTQRTEQDVRDFVQLFIDWQNETPRTKFQLAIEYNGQLIGNCGLRQDEEQQANIGFEIAPTHWRQGYATEATRTICQYGFNDLNLHRIWSWCLADNQPSARVLEKLGLRQEGRLVQREFIKGQWRDHLLYAILEDEWQTHHPNIE